MAKEIELNAQIQFIEEQYKVQRRERVAAEKKITRLEKDLERLKSYAEHYEFILFVRWWIERFEKDYCENLPAEADFAKEVRKFSSEIQSRDLQSGIHFRKWLWILLSSSSYISEQITNLRTSLNMMPTVTFGLRNKFKLCIQSYQTNSMLTDVRDALTKFMVSGS